MARSSPVRLCSLNQSQHISVGTLQFRELPIARLATLPSTRMLSAAAACTLLTGMWFRQRYLGQQWRGADLRISRIAVCLAAWRFLRSASSSLCCTTLNSGMRSATRSLADSIERMAGSMECWINRGSLQQVHSMTAVVLCMTYQREG